MQGSAEHSCTIEPGLHRIDLAGDDHAPTMMARNLVRRRRSYEPESGVRQAALDLRENRLDEPARGFDIGPVGEIADEKQLRRFLAEGVQHAGGAIDIGRDDPRPPRGGPAGQLAAVAFGEHDNRIGPATDLRLVPLPGVKIRAQP